MAKLLATWQQMSVKCRGPQHRQKQGGKQRLTSVNLWLERGCLQAVELGSDAGREAYPCTLILAGPVSMEGGGFSETHQHFNIPVWRGGQVILREEELLLTYLCSPSQPS